MSNLIKTAVFIIFFIVSQTAYTQTIITQDGKYGLMIENGEVAIKPYCDTIYIDRASCGTAMGPKVFIIYKNHKYGYAMNTKDKGFIKSNIEYDTIIHKSLFIEVKRGDKWGFIGYRPITGSNIFHSLNHAIGMRDIYISDIIYDEVYAGGFLKKDNKYGRYLYLDIIIPPIYDTVPIAATIMDIPNDKSEIALRNTNYFYARKKNELYGVLMETKLILPIIYSKEELIFIGEGKIIINQKGKPIKVFNSLDSTFLTLHSNGQPLLSTGTGKYFDTRIYYCNILSKLTNRYDSVISRNAIYHYTLSDSSKYLTENKKYLESSVSYQIILYDDITGEAIEYCKPNCRYQTGENFIVEYDIGNPQDSLTKISFYTPFEKRKICSFTLNDSYKFFEWDYTRDGNHTKIRLYRKTNNKYRYKTLGYIKNSTLTYKRRIPIPLFISWVDYHF